MSAALMLQSIKANPDDRTAYLAMADAVEEEGGDGNPWRQMAIYVFSVSVGAGEPLYHAITHIEEQSDLEPANRNSRYFVCVQRFNLSRIHHNHYRLRMAKPDDWFIDWGDLDRAKPGQDQVVYAERSAIDAGQVEAITYLNVRPETFVKLWELGERLLKETEVRS